MLWKFYFSNQSGLIAAWKVYGERVMKKHIYNCDYCSNNRRNPCYACHGKHGTEVLSQPIKNKFYACEYGAESDLQCDNCETFWEIDSDLLCDIDDGEFGEPFYECTCGAVLDVWGEWERIYYVKGRIIANV